MKKSYRRLVTAICLLAMVGCKRAGHENDSTTTTGPAAETPEPVAEQPGATGTLAVLGAGTDMYEVFDETGEKKIKLVRTGAALELPAGPCLVVLSGTRKRVVFAIKQYYAV